MIFDCDPSLQPYDISIRNADLKAWEFKEAPQPPDVPDKKKGHTAHNSKTLVVHLREPFQGEPSEFENPLSGSLSREQALGQPRPAFLRHARLRGESLKVAIHPDVHMEAWDAGRFRLVSSTTDSDGSEVLSLMDPAPGLDPSRRPGGQFKSQEFKLFTRQSKRVAGRTRGSRLATGISYDMVRGSLFN